MSAAPPASAQPANTTTIGPRAHGGAALLSPAERLTASRARLRIALMEITHPPPRPTRFDGLGELKAQLLERLKSLPGAAIIIESLQDWWERHPLHAAGVVAEEASRSFIVPLARKNPYALILGSLVVGALFVVSKPWKWLLRPALFVGLVPQLAAHAVRRMPIESWIQMLESIIPAKASAAKDGEPASRLPRTS